MRYMHLLTTTLLAKTSTEYSPCGNTKQSLDYIFLTENGFQITSGAIVSTT